jgi:hypothetical protein
MTKRLHGVVAAFVLVLFAAGGTPDVLAAEKADLLTAAEPLPEELLGVLEIRDPGALEEQLTEFVRAVEPGAGTGWSLRKRLGNRLVHSSQIDPAAPIRILLVRSGAGTPQFVTVFQPAEGANYIQDLRQRMTWQDEERGVHLFTYEKQEFDAEGFEAAAPEDRKNAANFMKPVEKPFVADVVKGLACAGRQKEAVRLVAERLEKGAITGKPLLAGGGTANVSLRVGAMADILALGTEQILDFFRGSMLAQGTGDQTHVQKATNSMAIQIEAAMALCNQIETMRVGFDADGERMRYAVGIDAVPGSGLEAYIRTVPQGIPDVIGQIPADAFAFAAIRLGNLEQFTETWTHYAVRMMEVWQEQKEGTATYRKNVAALIADFGDEWAFAMQGGLPMRVFQVARFKSPAAAERSLGAAVQMTQDAPGFGFSMNAERATHAGHPVAAWRMQFDQMHELAGAGDNMPAQARQMQKKVLGKMFGEDGLVQHTVVKGEDWITQMGVEEAEGNRWAEIDRILQGDYERLTADPAVDALVDGAGETSSGVFFLRLTGLVGWQLKLTRAFNPMMAAMMPRIDFEEGPGLSGYVHVDGRTAGVIWQIPSGEVKALTDGFKKMMKQRRGAGGKPDDPNAPRPRPEVREPEKKVTVEVRNDDRYGIGDEILTYEALDKRMYELGESDPPIKLLITADRDVPYEKVTKVMELAKAAGIKWISLMVQEDE